MHDLCIFHAEKKPADEFKTQFLAELKRVDEDDSIDEFNGQQFIFPEIDLNNLTFEKAVNFRKAQFSENVSFVGCEFKRTADFGSAKFGAEAYFGAAEFGAEANFGSAKFGAEAYFGAAEFGAAAYFGSAEFGAEADFGAAEFGAEANFGSAEFGAEADFAFAKFGAEANFGSAEFGAEAKFLESTFTGEVDTRRMTFVDPKLISFVKIDLGKFLFSHTDITEVHFAIDCKWPSHKGRLAVYDEIKSPRKTSAEDIEQIYLRLQNNFENDKRFAKAGDFYIGAMEMRREQLSSDSNKYWRWLRQNVFSMHALYRSVSLYGERYARVVAIMLAVVLLFQGLYLLSGFNYQHHINGNGSVMSVNYDLAWKFEFPTLEEYGKALELSVYAFTFQKGTPARVSEENRLVSILQNAVSAILLAIFLLALRRRFRR